MDSFLETVESPQSTCITTLVIFAKPNLQNGYKQGTKNCIDEHLVIPGSYIFFVESLTDFFK